MHRDHTGQAQGTVTAFSKAILADLIIGKLTAGVVQVSDPDDAANRVFIDSDLWGTDKPSILLEYRDLAGGQQAISGAFIIAGEDATFGNFVFLRSPQELTQGYMALRLTPTKAYFLGSNVGRVYAVEIGSALIPVDVSILGTGALAMGSGDLSMDSGDLVQTSGGINSPAMRPQEAENATDTTVTSTAYAAHANAVSIVFVAPPSGMVRVDYYYTLRIQPNAAALRVLFGAFELRTGSIIGSGTIVFAASDNHAVSAAQIVSTVAGHAGASGFSHVSGLTPGGTYHVRTMGRVNATPNTQALDAHRRIAVTPCM
jgi:hypothetical protein